MGMYTEIFVNIDLDENTPEEVIYVLKGLCRNVTCSANFKKEEFNHAPVSYDEVRFKKLTENFGSRFDSLFSNMSYYTPNTGVSTLNYDFISGQWSLIGKGDIKNYNDEIESFFEWVSPWSDRDFLGYSMYEDAEKPTLMFRESFTKEEL